jgi:hypothetical protein
MGGGAVYFSEDHSSSRLSLRSSNIYPLLSFWPGTYFIKKKIHFFPPWQLVKSFLTCCYVSKFTAFRSISKASRLSLSNCKFGSFFSINIFDIQ